jgi:nucleotide-binding universal stress UspA family protein
MFETILVPLDGSEPGRAAFELALRLAGERPRSIVCIHAVDTRNAVVPPSGVGFAFDPTPLIQALEEEGKELLASAQARADAAGVRLATELIFDDPVAATVRSATDHAADVIVMGTHGRTGPARVFLGSTTEGVLRACSIPVLTVRTAAQAAEPAWPFESALVAVDESDPSDAGVALALEMGEREGVRLAFCNVVASEDILDKAGTYGYDPASILDEMRRTGAELVAAPLAKAQGLGVHAATIVVEGEPVRKLLEAAAEANADLIVIGSHGRRGLRRLFVGSVAENLVRDSPRPVLVVRVGRARSKPKLHV